MQAPTETAALYIDATGRAIIIAADRTFNATGLWSAFRVQPDGALRRLRAAWLTYIADRDELERRLAYYARRSKWTRPSDALRVELSHFVAQATPAQLHRLQQLIAEAAL